MALNPTDAPIFDNTSGTAPNFALKPTGDQALSNGGGYNPSSPSAYLTGATSIGGDSFKSQNYDQGSALAGSYDSRGGYVAGTYDNDPNNGQGGASYDSADARRLLLPPNAATSGTQSVPSIAIQDANTSGSGAPSEDDWRIRISLAAGANIFYKATGAGANTLMDPLKDTNGVIFPYTPSIQMSHVANYTPTSPTHSNYSQQFYNNSEVSDITLTGDFTVQGIDEGKYLLAAIYFFRAATKMFFGQGANAGNPPPIVFLDGYGSHYFPHVPCVITNFTHTMSNEVDYIQIPVVTTTLTAPNISAVNDSLGNGSRIGPNFNVPGKPTTAPTKAVTSSTRVPASSTIMVTLKPVYSRKNVHDNFNLDSFAAGKLIQTATTGGFI
jgi:hypothetical protein